MIDGGLPEDWPQEILQALEAFKQGDLVEQPPIFYVGATAHPIWDLTATGDDSDAEILVDVHQDERPPFGIITTQTCDLAEAGAPRQPWFQVSPVYRLEYATLDANTHARLTEGRILEWVLLDGPPSDVGEFWLADLRIEVPLEKGWLVGRLPVPAFAGEAGYLDFAERLASRRQRGAVADAVHTAIVKPLKRSTSSVGPTRRASILGPVAQVRLSLHPDRLAPTDGQLLVILKEDDLPIESRERWDAWWDSLRVRAEQVGVNLLANQYVTLDQLSARAFMSSVEIDVELF